MQKIYSEEVKKLLVEYPFEKCGEKLIKNIIYQYNIRNYSYEYDECFDAGMQAYLYSIHRCAAIKCFYVESYIKKVMRIYIKCAIVICNESRNICKENGFKNVELDQIENNNKY